MERIKLVRKVLIHFILIHLILGAVYLLSYRVSHPVFKYFKATPFGVQLTAISVIDLISFVIVGWIYASNFKEKKKLNLMVEWPSILMALLLMGVFAIVYYLSKSFYNKDLMLVYVILNPWYGMYMFRVSEQHFYSLWWMVSTIIPSLGYFIGIKSRYMLKGSDE